MKPTLEVPAEMLENKDEFNNDFYRRFTLRHAPEPLALTEEVSKNYLFPTFYGDVTCAMAIFLCSYEKAAGLIAQKLGPGVRPVKMTRGRALLAFSCYEYKKVMGVAPYNEIAAAIPVMVNAGFSPPVLPMVADRFKRFGYYIAAMPVTSKENQIRGNKIWGLPKVTQEIDIRREGRDCVASAFEEDGREYLKVVIPMDGKPTDFDVTSNLYSRLDGRLLQSETNFRARFNVTKHMKMLFLKGATPDRKYLTIGDSPSADLYHDLEIEPHPFQFRYVEGMCSCFDLPNSNPPEWVTAS